jgi:hypothetical protein
MHALVRKLEEGQLQPGSEEEAKAMVWLEARRKAGVKGGAVVADLLRRFQAGQLQPGSEEETKALAWREARREGGVKGRSVVADLLRRFKSGQLQPGSEEEASARAFAEAGKNSAKPLSVPRAIAPGQKYPQPNLSVSVLGGLVHAPYSSQVPPDGLPVEESAFSRRVDSLQLAAHEGGWREAQPASQGQRGVCVSSQEGLARLATMPAFVQRQAPLKAADLKEERGKIGSRAREIFAELWPDMVEEDDEKAVM